MAEPSLLIRQEDGRTVLYAAGRWDIAWIANQPAIPKLATGGVLMLDGSGIETLDPSGACKLMDRLHAAGIHLEHLEVRGMPPMLLEVLGSWWGNTFHASTRRRRGRERECAITSVWAPAKPLSTS